MDFKKNHEFTDIMSINPVVDHKFLDLPDAFLNPTDEDIKLYKYLFDEIDNYATGHIASIILILAESQYQDSFAVDKELHMMSTMIKLLNELK